MRKGELGKLRWNDIDFERGLALLHDTKNAAILNMEIPPSFIRKRPEEV